MIGPYVYGWYDIITMIVTSVELLAAANFKTMASLWVVDRFY